MSATSESLVTPASHPQLSVTPTPPAASSHAANENPSADPVWKVPVDRVNSKIIDIIYDPFPRRLLPDGTHTFSMSPNYSTGEGWILCLPSDTQLCSFCGNRIADHEKSQMFDDSLVRLNGYICRCKGCYDIQEEKWKGHSRINVHIFEDPTVRHKCLHCDKDATMELSQWNNLLVPPYTRTRTYQFFCTTHASEVWAVGMLSGTEVDVPTGKPSRVPEETFSVSEFGTPGIPYGEDKPGAPWRYLDEYHSERIILRHTTGGYDKVGTLGSDGLRRFNSVRDYVRYTDTHAIPHVSSSDRVVYTELAADLRIEKAILYGCYYYVCDDDKDEVGRIVKYRPFVYGETPTPLPKGFRYSPKFVTWPPKYLSRFPLQ